MTLTAIATVATARVAGPIPIAFDVLDAAGDRLVVRATMTVPDVDSGDMMDLSMEATVWTCLDVTRQLYDLAKRMYLHELAEQFRTGDRVPFAPDHEHWELAR